MVARQNFSLIIDLYSKTITKKNSDIIYRIDRCVERSLGNNKSNFHLISAPVSKSALYCIFYGCIVLVIDNLCSFLHVIIVMTGYVKVLLKFLLFTLCQCLLIWYRNQNTMLELRDDTRVIREMQHFCVHMACRCVPIQKRLAIIVDEHSQRLGNWIVYSLLDRTYSEYLHLGVTYGSRHVMDRINPLRHV